MIRIVVVCEAQSDFEIATALADRCLMEAIDWLESEWRDSTRNWLGESSSTPFYEWKSLKKLVKQLKLDVDLPFQSDRVSQDAFAARRALLIIDHLQEHFDAVLLIRDSDGVTERTNGLKQGCDAVQLKQPAVIGVAHTKRECWVLSGFDPYNDLEKRLLNEEREYLGFDPVEKPQELTAKHDPQNDKRSAKRVLNKLTQSNYAREEICWMETSLNKLRNRVENNGLSAFLNEVQVLLMPLMIRPDARGGRA